MKKFVAMMLTILMVASVFPLNVFADGETIIRTAEDLYNIRNDLSGSYKLANDIDLSSYDNWDPIGWDWSSSAGLIANSFTGTLDGDGHTIKNLKVAYKQTSYLYYFAFISINKGTVKNLNFDNAQITGGNGGAVIASWNYNGTIENCHVTNSDVSAYAANTVTGGASGIVARNNGNITKCSVEDTNFHANYASTGKQYQGGIAGINMPVNKTAITLSQYYQRFDNMTSIPINTLQRGIIEDCYVANVTFNATGTIVDTTGANTTTSATNAGQYNGGITGYNYADQASNKGAVVQNCYVKNVEVRASYGYAGGVVGYNANYATVMNVIAMGKVTVNTGTSKKKTYGPIYGTTATTTATYVQNNYYDKSVNTYGTYQYLTSSTDSTELKNGSAPNATFTEEHWKFANNAYPRLAWEGDFEFFTVEFYVDGELYYSEEVLGGEKVSGLTTPTKTGYLFTGWDNDEAFGKITRNLTVNGSFAEDGDGSEENPYRIYTPEHFNALRTATAGKYYKVMRDIDFSNYNNGVWNPIGNTAAQYFTANLDGDGHTLTGFHVAANNTYGNGIFGTVNAGATIKNLIIKDSTFTNATQTYKYDGLVVGMNNGTIDNVKVVDSSVTNYALYTGGIVGNNSTTGVITNCSFINGTVKNTHTSSSYASNVGGIVGYYANTTTPISCCYVDGLRIEGYSIVGGITGPVLADVTIKDCHVNDMTSLTLNAGTSGTSGGIAASNLGTITECSATNINLGQGSSGGWQFNGGISGGNGATGIISYSYVENLLINNSSRTGNACIKNGGITGNQVAGGQVYDCYVNNVEIYGAYMNGGAIGLNLSDAANVLVFGNINVMEAMSTWPQYSGPVIGATNTGGGSTSNATLTSGFYLNTSPIVNGYGVAKTAAQFTSGSYNTLSDTFNNELSDGTKVWQFANGAYPKLYWQGRAVTYTVKFVDYDGTVLQEGLVEAGTAAQAPDEPTRSGYIFSGWSTDAYLNVQSDLTVTATYAENGNGTQENPYKIYTPKQLADINGKNSYYIVMRDINLATYNNGKWTPIATFGGNLNGNNKKITVLNVSQTEVNGGLFAQNTGTIKNLTVDAATIIAGNYSGIVVGNNYGKLERVFVTGTSFIVAGSVTGGLVGQNSEGSTIYQCYVDGVTVSGGQQVGGITGTNSGTIEESYANATVSGSEYVGGFVGFSADTSIIKNCYSHGSVSASNHSGGFAGGHNPMGASSAYYENCYTYANIKSASFGQTSNWSRPFTGDAYFRYDMKATLFFETGRAKTSTNANYTIADSDTTISTPHSAAELKTEATYAGWNKFSKYWAFESANTYPILKWMSSHADDPTTEEYTVIFVDWDGTELKRETVEEGQDATAPADPTRTGYDFKGWDKTFTDVHENLTVTAQYEIHKFLITYVTMVPFKIEGSEIVEYGQKAEGIENPTKEGYTFIGWFTKPEDIEGGVEFDFNSPIYSDYTLYSHWEQNKYVITVKDGYDDSTIETITVLDNETIEGKFTNPDHANVNLGSGVFEHYRFDKYTVNNEEIDISTKTFDRDTTVVVEYQKYWFVTFMYEDLYMKQVTVDDGGHVEEPDDFNVPAPDNMEFDGWYSGAVKFISTVPITKDMVIEAKFKAHEYTVNFYGAKELDEHGQFVYEIIDTATVRHGESVEAPEIGEYVPDKYEFAGWENQNLTNVTGNLEVYAAYTRVVELNDVTFYARFTGGEKENAYIGKVTVNVGETLAKANYPSAGNFTGYHFVGWSVESVEVADKNTQYIVYANFEINTYTVTFVDEAGAVLSTQTREHGAKLDLNNIPEAPYKEDHKFDGWSDGSKIVDITKYVVNGNVTLTAQYSPIGAVATIILYDTYAGEAVAAYSFNIRKAPADVEDFSVPSNDAMKHDGYTFLGWFDKDGNTFDFSAVIEGGYAIAYAKYEVVKVAALTAPTQTISATADLGAAIAQANAVAGTGRVEISLTTDATITGMVDLTRANVTINGNGHKVTGASTTAASGGLRIKADGLMLKDITWDTSSNKAWAMRVLGNFNVYFDGTVNVKSASGYAGIHVTQDLSNNDVTATFIGVTNDAVLNVTGGQSAAAIGSSNAQNSKSGKIVLRAGTFNLTGGLNAAAIGGAARGSAGEVVIRGNYVEEGSTEAIKLVVNANGGKYGAAIGTGYLYSEKNKTFGKLAIADGAVVNATAGANAATFGSGKRTYDPNGEKATISGKDTVVNFIGSATSGYKDGIVEFRGGNFFSSSTLNQGMMITGNEVKVLRINASVATPKAQNTVIYTNAYMQFYQDADLGKVRVSLADAQGKEYEPSFAAKFVGKVFVRTSSTTFNFVTATDENNISRALTFVEGIEQLGYKMSFAKNTATLTK